MGIRHELHLKNIDFDKPTMPLTCFTMKRKEKDDFLRVLKSIQVPDDYASNISQCIQLQERKITGLKSHDSHILMQQFLLITIQGSLPKKVTSTLIDLSCIFKELCSKTLQVKELKQLESRIAVTLCNLESIFPPSFFTIMVHLVTYMAMEAKIARPIHYRWMYPV